MQNLNNLKMDGFTYQDWTAYFVKNGEQRLCIDFSQEQELPQPLHALVFPAIRLFQVGESSEGKHLLKTAEAFANAFGQPDYPETVKEFIKEENWHSAYLKKYMDFHKVNAADGSRLQGAFQKLRRLGGLKCEVNVLVTAEMIALTFYNALANCTASSALKSICAQMLHDELPHIVFQSYTLGHFKNNAVSHLWRKTLMCGVSLLLWLRFHKIYQVGGYGFLRFWQENFGYLRQSIQLTKKFEKQNRAFTM